MKSLVRLASLAAFLLAAAPAGAAVRIVLIDVDGQPVESTSAVRFTPLGSFRATDLAKSAALEMGDLLDCSRDDVRVGLSRGEEETSVVVSGPFRFAVDPSDPKTLRLDLLAGTAFVESSDDTEVVSGATRTAAKRTSYMVRVDRDRHGSTVEAVVFEGEVECSRGGRTLSVTGGTKCRYVKGVGFDTNPVAPPDRETAATLAARTQVALAIGRGATIAQPQIAIDRIRESYLPVLADPKDARARMRLVDQKLQLGVTEGALYQLERTDASQTGDPGLWAEKTLAKRALGRVDVTDADAREAYDSLTRRDPSAARTKEWVRRVGDGIRVPKPPSEEGVARALELLGSGDPKGAWRILSGMEESGRLDGRVLLALSVTAARLRRTEEAAGYALAAFSLDPPAGPDRELVRKAFGHLSRFGGELPSTIAPTREWLFVFLDGGLEKEAYGMFRKRLEAGGGRTADARDLFGAGVASSRLGDAREATGWMKRALVTDEESGVLTDEQRETAAKILGETR